MKFFRPLQPGQRLASLHRLALLLLALLAAVALLQADRLGRQAEQEQHGAQDSASLVHGLTRMVDDGRGLEALHLAQDSAARQRALETELLRQRQRLQARLTAAAVGRSAQEQAYLDAVTIRLGAYWQVQDQLLQASRQALDQASLVPQAQALLNGRSQDSYRAVIDALETWWRQQEAELAASAQHSRSQALLCLRGAMVAVLLLLSGLLLQALAAWRQRRASGGSSSGSGFEADEDAAPASTRRAAQRAQDIALRAQLLALNATVQAARGGGRRADLDAVASEAQALALRCAAAADQDGSRDSRLDPPSLPFMTEPEPEAEAQARADAPPPPPGPRSPG